MVKQSFYQLPLSDAFQKYIEKYEVSQVWGTCYLMDSMWCQPLIFLKDSKRDIFGVCDNVTINGVKVGTFKLQYKNSCIIINDVSSYIAFAKPEGYHLYDRITYNHIAQEHDLNDIIICAIVYVSNQYNLKVYHNQENIRTVENVYPKFGLDYFLKRAAIKYATCNGNKFSNYLYIADNNEIFQLDSSYKVPTFELSFDKPKYKDWQEFRKELSGENNALSIIFHNDGSKAAQVLFEFGRYADEFQVLPNIFADDVSLNYKITFINRPDDIYFVYFCAKKSKNILGYNLYQVPIYQYRYGVDNHPEESVIVTSFSKAEREYYKSVTNSLFNKFNYSPKNRHYLPTEIMNKYVCSQTMVMILNMYIMSNIDFEWNGYRAINKELEEKCKKKYADIYSELIKTKKLSPRWKSEAALFKMIAKYFPDAIYQYRDSWLAKQSLDIFIPTLKVGFEYQGLQHYEVVTVFGDELQYEHRLVLDRQKKDICEKNNVLLIEWKYDEPITQIYLKEKLLQAGIII